MLLHSNYGKRDKWELSDMTSGKFQVQERRQPDDWRVRSALARTSFPEEETEQSVSTRFEKMADTYADRIAFQHRGHRMTYEALNVLANRIAWSVYSECDGKNNRIALLFKDIGPALAAMIGVLKSGNIYITVDPSYPPKMIRYILENSEARMIVTDGSVFAESLGKDRCRILNVNALQSIVSERNPGRPASADAIAYIMYTSGSTGRPKGVIQTHRNLLHFIRSYSNSLGITDSDRLSLLPSLSFSASLMDIYGALFNGGSVHPYNVREEGVGGLADWLTEERITVYHSIPTLFRHFTESLNERRSFPYLRLIDLGGEPVNARDVALFKKQFSRDCVLVNHMAFTEASVAAQYFIDHDSEIAGGAVPAGYAASGVEIFLVNEEGREAGIGEPGEIMLKSRYLSPGYWRNPALTSTCFPPGTDDPNERIYRTGDIGRKKENGALEHIGRKDHRIKVRGYTIEPAEIEAALFEMNGLREAVVARKENLHGDHLLVAYVVPSQGNTTTVNELRDHLKKKLPVFMVPSRYVFMDALPTTQSGKIDRNALPLPGDELSESERVSVSPGSLREKRLAEIWAEILGLKSVGIKDNFFDLGGDSLMAVPLFVLIEEETGQRISPSVLYGAPTIEELAAVIDKMGESGPETCLIPIRRGGSRPPLLLFAAPSGDSLVYAHLVKYIEPEQPIYGVNSSADVFNRTIDEVVLHHVDEICKAFSAGPFLLSGFSSGGVVAFETALQLRARGYEIAFMSMIDTVYPAYFKRRRSFCHPVTAYNFLVNLPFWFYYSWLNSDNKMVRTGRLLRDVLGLKVNEGNEFQDELSIVQKTINWLQNYTVRPYDGRIVFYRARARWLDMLFDLDEDWRKYSRSLDVYTIPGNHHDLLKEPYVRVLAKGINAELERLSEKTQILK
jgi:amino acid adenylation domain-containing protein